MVAGDLVVLAALVALDFVVATGVRLACLAAGRADVLVLAVALIFVVFVLCCVSRLGFVECAVLLVEAFEAAFVAFRAGAFSAEERLTIFFKRAGFNLRPRVEEARPDAGLEGALFTPLITASLIGCSARFVERIL